MSFRRPLLLAAPVALMAGLVLAAPASAAVGGLLDDDLLELAQATPPAPPAAGAERRDRQTFDPKALCLEQVARRAGNRTYLKIKLDLKADQMAAWDAFAKASDAADVKDTARCNSLPSEMKERPNYVERLGMEEAYTKARVERIEAVKPSLTALYETLSPEQKASLDHPRPMGRMMGHRRGGPGPR